MSNTSVLPIGAVSQPAVVSGTSPIEGVSPIEAQYNLKVLAATNDVAKQMGHAAVQLIEAAQVAAPEPQPPPAGPDGKGSILNKYA
jgi:hypothetical protein